MPSTSMTRELALARAITKVNGLAWCSQSVMEAVEQAMEASIGAAPSASQQTENGFEADRIERYLAAERLRRRGCTGAPSCGCCRR